MPDFSRIEAISTNIGTATSVKPLARSKVRLEIRNMLSGPKLNSATTTAIAPAAKAKGTPSTSRPTRAPRISSETASMLIARCPRDAAHR